MSADPTTDGAADKNHDDTGEEPLNKKELIRQQTDSDLLQKGTPPMISFRQDHTIAPNSTAVDRFFASAEGVSFAYNPDENALWIIPLDNHDPSAEDEYKLTENKDITSKPIFDKIGLEIDATHRYNPEWDDEFEALMVDLDQDAEKVGQNTNDGES